MSHRRRRRPARRHWLVLLTALVAVVVGAACLMVAPGSRPAAGAQTAAVTVIPFTTADPAPALPIASVPPSPSPTLSPSASSSAPVPKPGQRVITFVNHTSQTVWAAAQEDPKYPMGTTGWVVPAGASVGVLLPDHYSGRLWGRTGCQFDGNGQGHCVTGDCNGRFQCGTAGSRDPETLAEFTLGSWNGMDFYDVNLDGYNLPMFINASGGKDPDPVSQNGCDKLGCTHDLLSTCPAELQQKSGGQEVGCLLPCEVFNTDNYCCRGQYSGRAACVPARIWPVNYAAIFKAAEPTGYSYVYDDQTSTMACKGACDYRITFGVSS